MQQQLLILTPKQGSCFSSFAEDFTLLAIHMKLR